MSNAFKKTQSNFAVNSPFTSTTTFKPTTNPLGQLDISLRNILNNILELLASYADGDFSTLAQDLTLQRYNTLSTLLYESRTNSNVDYEIIRNSALRSLKGLQRAYLQYTELTITSKLYNETKKKNRYIR